MLGMTPCTCVCKIDVKSLERLLRGAQHLSTDRFDLRTIGLRGASRLFEWTLDAVARHCYNE